MAAEMWAKEETVIPPAPQQMTPSAAPKSDRPPWFPPPSNRSSKAGAENPAPPQQMSPRAAAKNDRPPWFPPKSDAKAQQQTQFATEAAVTIPPLPVQVPLLVPIVATPAAAAQPQGEDAPASGDESDGSELSNLSDLESELTA